MSDGDVFALRSAAFDGGGHVEEDDGATEDALIELAKQAYWTDRITDRELERALDEIFKGEMDEHRLGYLIEAFEATREAPLAPAGREFFTLASGWWRRPDGSTFKVSGGPRR